MARAKVTHSDDAVHIEFKGDKRSPEPTLGVIKFPGGHVEVSRCSDGTYYAHINVVDSANIIDSRLDFQRASEEALACVRDIPQGEFINHIAVRISNKVPHFDPDAGESEDERPTRWGLAK